MPDEGDQPPKPDDKGRTEAALAVATGKKTATQAAKGLQKKFPKVTAASVKGWVEEYMRAGIAAIKKAEKGRPKKGRG